MSEGWSWVRNLFRGGSDSQTFFLPGCETLRIESERLKTYAGKEGRRPQAIGVGIHMLKNRVASQICQERADTLTRQGKGCLSKRCRCRVVYLISHILLFKVFTEHPTGRSTLNLVPL